MEYRVFKSEYYNKLGESTNTSFFIKKRKTILGFSYWKTITHKESGMGDYYNVETTFKTKKDTEKFIKNVLCANLPRQKWLTKPISELSCKI
jgi:hypothetical protein